MVRKQTRRWLEVALACVLVAGCGSKPSRVLSPSSRQSTDGSLAGVPVGRLAGDGIPPSVRITCPRPSPLIAHVAPAALRIVWEGNDPDGSTSLPVQYKYILLGPGSEFPVALAFADPDSLRRYYANHAAGPWAGWDSTTADTPSVRLRNLTPEAGYVFAVIAFDETGLYSTVFSFQENLIRVRATFAGYLGPVLTISGHGLRHQFTGYRPTLPSSQARLQVGTGQPVSFDWLAATLEPCEGVEMRSYQWALDIVDLFDQTQRIDEETDLQHWSVRSIATTSATLPPFQLSSPPAPEDHLFYVQVEDIVGVRTLGTVRITVVPSTNQLPDCSGVIAQLASDWPADGSFVPVSLAGATDPDDDPVTIAATRVTQDEPVDGEGDGSVCPDAMIVDGVAHVRRERTEGGNGRVYTIWFRADDGQGGTCYGALDVCIPAGGSGQPCVKDALSVDSLAGCGDAVRRGARAHTQN